MPEPTPVPDAAEVVKAGRYTDDHGDDIDIMRDFYADGSGGLVITQQPHKGGPQASIRLTPKLIAWLVDALPTSPDAPLTPAPGEGLSAEDRGQIAACELATTGLMSWRHAEGCGALLPHPERSGWMGHCTCALDLLRSAVRP